MFSSLIKSLLSHKKVAVFSHLCPDGDCLGSQIALCLWLEKNGIQTAAFNEDEVNENMQWLLEFKTVEKPTPEKLSQFEAFVFVDGNALYRFGANAEALENSGKSLYMVDHHPDPASYFNDFVSDVSASSTCELIYRLYDEHNPNQIDRAAAKAMYTGLVTDTGSFQFESVKPATLKAAAHLLETGSFTPNEVVEKIYSTKKLNQIKLTALALGTIELHLDQQIATMYVNQSMFQETQTSNEDTEGLVAYPLSIQGVKACVFFREDAPGNIKLSLRSRSSIDVNQWAKSFSGGGHVKAAGAHFEGSLEEAIKSVLEEGRKHI